MNVPSASEAASVRPSQPFPGTLWIATAEFWMRHAQALIAHLRGLGDGQTASVPLSINVKAETAPPSSES